MTERELIKFTFLIGSLLSHFVYYFQTLILHKTFEWTTISHCIERSYSMYINYTCWLIGWILVFKYLIREN